MKLILLGTTGYHPSDRRETACLMFPESGIIFDAGSGMYRAGEHLQTDSLDIYLSHAHLDHIVGLTYLYDVLEGSSVQSVRVHAEEEKLAAVREHLFSDLLFPTPPPFDSVVLEEQSLLPDGGKLRSFPLQHPGGSIGFRIDWADRAFAYVTDTVADPSADYVEHIQGVDLLVHECYFADVMQDRGQLTGHSWLTPVAEVAKKSAAKRTVLVHLNPMFKSDAELELHTVSHIHPGLEIGSDRMEIDF